MGGFQTETVATATLVKFAAPYNPRKMGKDEFLALRRSLRQFGCVEPIIVNRRTNHVVGGHQRVKAASAEGINTLPVVWVELDDIQERQLQLGPQQNQRDMGMKPCSLRCLPRSRPPVPISI